MLRVGFATIDHIEAMPSPDPNPKETKPITGSDCKPFLGRVDLRYPGGAWGHYGAFGNRRLYPLPAPRGQGITVADKRHGIESGLCG
jgi:hypothetical protein